MAPVLQLTELSAKRGDQFTLQIPLFQVVAGEVVALVGPNGSGKSTLLQIAALLLRPDHGQVSIDGVTQNRGNLTALRRKTATVFQSPLLFNRPVLENVESGLRFRGVAGDEARKEAVRWLERFGVDGLADRNARALSGGEAQRVNLARAFVTRPRLLLLDEPFAFLDAKTRAMLIEDFASQLNSLEGAVILVTHDTTEVVALATRIVTIESGRIVSDSQDGTPHAVAG